MNRIKTIICFLECQKITYVASDLRGVVSELKLPAGSFIAHQHRMAGSRETDYGCCNIHDYLRQHGLSLHLLFRSWLDCLSRLSFRGWGWSWLRRGNNRGWSWLRRGNNRGWSWRWSWLRRGNNWGGGRRRRSGFTLHGLPSATASREGKPKNCHQNPET